MFLIVTYFILFSIDGVQSHAAGFPAWTFAAGKEDDEKSHLPPLRAKVRRFANKGLSISLCPLWKRGRALRLGLNVDREAVDLHILIGWNHEISFAVDDANLQHVAALRSHRDGGVRGLYLEMTLLN